jgi:hypothetical protein
MVIEKGRRRNGLSLNTEEKILLMTTEKERGGRHN